MRRRPSAAFALRITRLSALAPTFVDDRSALSPVCGCGMASGCILAVEAICGALSKGAGPTERCCPASESVCSAMNSSSAAESSRRREPFSDMVSDPRPRGAARCPVAQPPPRQLLPFVSFWGAAGVCVTDDAQRNAQCEDIRILPDQVVKAAASTRARVAQEFTTSIFSIFNSHGAAATHACEAAQPEAY